MSIQVAAIHVTGTVSRAIGIQEHLGHKCWNFDFDDNICDAVALELYLKSL